MRPTLEMELLPPLASITLSEAVRILGGQIERLEMGRKLDQGDLMLNSGMTTLDAFGTVMWFHE